MRSYGLPLPGDAPPDVRAVVDMMLPVYDLDLAGLRHDAAGQAAIRDHIAPRVHPAFEVQVTFAAPRSPLRGPDALIEAWREWLSVFSSYRPRLEEVVDAGGGRVALFGRDAVATLEGIEMTMPVGAIYEVREGLMVRARFFPDQATARAEIG